MPQLSELQTTQTRGHLIQRPTVELAVEETLVPDHRTGRSTAQIMEDKLRRLTRYRTRDGKPN